MKKILIGMLMAGVLVSSGTVVAKADTNNSVNKSKVVSVGDASTEKSLVDFQSGVNNLSDISSAKATNFDKPLATENGILLKMESTVIDTKYGKMQIDEDSSGFTVTNLSNSKAPILKVGVVNRIYEINSQVDVKGIATPTLYNKDGQAIKGTIITPSIDTSKAGYGEKYIEGKDSEGNIVIAPFVYNVVSFKDSINIAKGVDVKTLGVDDILNGGNENLRAYVSHYKEGDSKVIVGVSRGVASIRKEIPITFGETTKKEETKKIVKTATNTESKKTDVQADYKVPMLIQIVISPITYIVLAIILIALICFLCF